VTVSSEWELEEALRCTFNPNRQLLEFLGQGPVLRLNVEVSEERQSGDFILVLYFCFLAFEEST